MSTCTVTSPVVAGPRTRLPCVSYGCVDTRWLFQQNGVAGRRHDRGPAVAVVHEHPRPDHPSSVDAGPDRHRRETFGSCLHTTASLRPATTRVSGRALQFCAWMVENMVEAARTL